MAKDSKVLTGDMLGTALCLALGIPTKHVRRVIVDCNVGNPAVVTVYEMYPSLEAPKELMQNIKRFKVIEESAEEVQVDESDDSVFEDDDEDDDTDAND